MSSIPLDLSLLLMLAALVIVPLAIRLAAYRHEKTVGLNRIVVIVQPVAAACAAISLLLPAGILAGALAALWLIFTVLIALLGVLGLIANPLRHTDDFASALALIYLPVGALWLLAARLGIQPFGFEPITVWLTALHFHYITMAGLVITGQVGHALRGKPSWPLYRIAALGMIVNPPLVAAGITITQFTGVHTIESIAATLLALSLLAISALGLFRVIPAIQGRLPRLLLIVSSCAVILTMLLAIAYATGIGGITISQMIMLHGWVNALVFGLCGLLGWRIVRARES